MAGKGDSAKAIVIALFANLAIFVAKSVAAALTRSSAMLAEAIHSLADVGNQVLLLWGMRAARSPASEDFPLGYGKAIYFWSFLVAILLFIVGGMFSVYEGVHKITDPHPIKWPLLALGVLGFGVVVEGISMAGCMREVNKARGGGSLWRWFRDSRQSELIVIFGEDLAALLGLAIAFIAVLVTWVTGNPVFDAIGSIAVGVLLIVVAVFIAIEIKALLIGQGADPAVKKQIYDFLEARPEIKRVLNLKTLQMGNDILLAVKAEMSRDLATRGLVEEINRVEADLRKRFPDVRWCFFEPDVED